MKNKKTVALVMAAAMAVTGALTGCGNNSDNQPAKKDNAPAKKENKVENKKEEESSSSELDKEQYLVVNLGEDPKTMDTSRASDTTSSNVATQIMEGLTRATVDENGNEKVVPGIAKSWDISEDGLTWTFHLRDANWSDGVPITAQDFEYAMKRAIDPNVGSVYAFILFPILNAEQANTGDVSLDEVGIKALDEKTLEMKLKAPCPYFEQLTYFKVMLPLREDHVKAIGETYGSNGSDILSTGPFVIKEWAPGDAFYLEKNPEYWAADEIKLEKLTMDIIKEHSSAYSAVLSGQLDMSGCTDPAWMKKFEDSGEFNYYSSLQPTTWYSYFNQEDRYFKNDKVRKAFIIAIDRQEQIDMVYDGMYEPAFADVPPTVQIGGKDFRDASGTDPVKRLLEEHPDPKALLIEGLTELGEDPDPSKMTVKVLSSGTSEKGKLRLDYRIQRYKDVLGINAVADVYDWGIYQEKVNNKEYQLATGSGWMGDYNDPHTFLEIFTSSSSINKIGMANKEYDELIAKGAVELDPNKRLEYYKRAEEILIYEEGGLIPEMYDKSSTFQKKYVKNVVRLLFGATDFTRVYTVGRP